MKRKIDEFESDSDLESEFESSEEDSVHMPITILFANQSFDEEPRKKKQKLSKKNENILEKIRNMETGKDLMERILESDFDINIKSKLVKEYETSTETYKINTYIERVLKIPVNKIKPVIPDGKNVPKFMKKLRKTLDEAIHGHNETKTEIIDYVSGMIRNPSGNPNILALCSPPGLGKTKFVRALGKALDLPFSQISFGGMNDPALLTGHDYTYIGSKPGKIYDVICKSGYMNGIVMLDEIDKIGDLYSAKTKEVYGVLTHLLDSTQNNEFYDNYIGNYVPIDLSKILFIASFNDECNIDPIVLNRMKVIKIKENSLKDKIDIVKKYTIPETIKNLKISDVIISDELIKYIINCKTVFEPGMRNINNSFKSLIGKINTLLFLDTASKSDRSKITKDLVYENMELLKDGDSVLVTKELIDKFLNKRSESVSQLMMYN
jgi:ATP-dependent Lon protease